MELIFLLVIVIVIIKVAQRGNNRLLCQSEGYRRGYWDGVCDAQNGRAKIEGSDGQVKLITENQAAASQFAGFVVTRNESNEPDVVLPTNAVPIEEDTNIPDEKTQIVKWLSPASNKDKEKNRQTTINVALCLLCYWPGVVRPLADLKASLHGVYRYGAGCCADWRVEHAFAFGD